MLFQRHDPLKYEPNILVFPKTTEEVSIILRFANSRKILVTTRGAGTSVVEGVLPRRGGIVLDMTKMDKTKKVAVEDLYVVVEPGVVLDKLNKSSPSAWSFLPLKVYDLMEIVDMTF